MKARYILLLLYYLIQNRIAEAEFTVGKDSITIHALGHASLMFEYNNMIIHVDPYSTQANYDLLPKADLILITHDHNDHYDVSALNKIKQDSTLMICTETVANLGTYTGLKIIMHNGDSITAKGIPVIAIPAYNIVDGTRHVKGVGNGYIITLGEKRIYIAGDTENLPKMDSLGKIDIAFIPMNQPYTMTPEMAADAAKGIHPDILYIYHYDASFTAELLNLLSNEGMEIRIGKSIYHENAQRQEEIPNLLLGNQTNDINIYPNPVKDYMIIENPNSILKASIYNLHGQLLKSIILVGGGKQEIDIAFLNVGTYFLKIDSKGRNSLQKKFRKE